MKAAPVRPVTWVSFRMALCRGGRTGTKALTLSSPSLGMDPLARVIPKERRRELLLPGEGGLGADGMGRAGRAQPWSARVSVRVPTPNLPQQRLHVTLVIA